MQKISSTNKLVKKKVVLLDSSSAILLEKSNLLSHLIRLYQVILAEAVYRELTENSYQSAGLFQSICSDSRIKVIKLNDISKSAPRTDPELQALNLGERETIHLYLGGTGDFILLDDGKAARYCHKNSLPFINALLVPKILKMCGTISVSSCNEKISEIIGIGRYSGGIIRLAEKMTRDDLEMFLA